MAVTLSIGIMSKEAYQKRTLSIARGTYKTAATEPKVWLISLDSLAKLLSPKNKTLLEFIRDRRPQSIQELAEMTGRNKGNISRTLRRMRNYGMVDLRKKEKGTVVPEVKFDRIQIEYGLESPEAA
jgi:predicted transcriptional regulator